MGQEVDPIVSTLWRIIHFLDEEERLWSTSATHDACREDDYWEREEEEEVRPNLRHDDDVKTSTKRSSRERGRSHERKGRSVKSDREMATASPYSNHSPGRGQTPSPKRSPAPAPPKPLRCPSPAPKAVSTNDVLPSDIQGWLTDQLKGRRVWCAVADMLFCVFEKPDSKVSKQVLLLPGCKVRQVEFKTASRDNRLVNAMGRKYKSKTISGVDKFQFWIENGTKRQRLMFGVDTKEELEQWIEVLTRVASVDTDAIAAEDEDAGRLNEETGSDGGRCVRVGGGGGGGDSDSEGILTPRFRSTESLKDPGRSRANTGGSESSLVDACVGRGRSYTPTQNLPRRIDFLSMSLGNARDVSKGSVDDIRRKLRREHEHTQEPKTAPLKATYTAPTTRHRSFFRVSGFESLFSRTKKRSASADDAKGRKPLKDNPPLKSGSTPPSLEMTRKEKRKLTRTGSEELPTEGSDEKMKEGRAFLSRSWDAEKSSRGLGSSIRRSASDLRSRLFSSSDKSRGPGLRLADLSDFRFQGYLHYKGRVRWVKVWAVLCRGCFYGFKSERPEETPLLVFVLPQCTVSYVSDSDTKKTKKQFAFKLSQPHCRSLSLCADNHHDLMTWLQALQLEACKVVAEEDVISVETDVSSVDAFPRVTSAVRRTASSSSSSGVASLSPSLNGNGNSGYWKTKGMRDSTVSEGSNQSFESDESGLVSGSSTLTSSSHLSPEMTSEGNDVSPRTLTPRSAKSSPRNNGGWSLAEELKRRHGLVALEDTNLNLQTDGDNDSSCGSSASQPNTPRRDDALTQVWSKDKGYLLQLIRTKLLRRKKKGGKELADGGSIYNRELARSHEGGLLIQHDEDVLLESNNEVSWKQVSFVLQLFNIFYRTYVDQFLS
ncbi:uncharacterized protein [Littorina saxatilis]|uniref:uncharacterized protein n=1 Tax=Littorina saxatilis TaxID=31220 RepID=UPI0038B41B0C